MAPERPFPVLIETGKSHPKTGLFPAVSQRFSDSFASGLPAVFQRFFRRFCQWSPSGFPAVFRRFSGGSTPVFQRFYQRFSSGFADGFLVVSGRFSGGSPATRPPGSTPIRLRRTPSSERNCRAIPYTLSSLQTQHSALSFDCRKNPAEYELKEKQDARERRLAAADIAQNLYQPIPGGDYVEHPAATGLHHRGDICLLRPLAALPEQTVLHQVETWLLSPFPPPPETWRSPASPCRTSVGSRTRWTAPRRPTPAGLTTRRGGGLRPG